MFGTLVKFLTIYKHPLNIFLWLRQSLDICAEEITEIACITLLQKPEGSMFVMVKLDTSLMEDISDDMDFCIKLARDEKVITLPGDVLGLKNWLSITFSIDLPSLKDAMERIKSFFKRHAKPHSMNLANSTAKSKTFESLKEVIATLNAGKEKCPSGVAASRADCSYIGGAGSLGINRNYMAEILAVPGVCQCFSLLYTFHAIHQAYDK
ncbi:hypothetical protein C5167_035861 [Papaver somniferum]|nr:hypothetical protein C5167_035861 [Papaver somniferum]